MIVGVAIILIATLTVAAITAIDHNADKTYSNTVDAVVAEPFANFDGVLVRAMLTTNLRVTPDRQSAVTVIIPTQEIAHVSGRTVDSEWLHLSYPVGTNIKGWAPVTHFNIERGDLAAVDITSAAEANIGDSSIVPYPETNPLPDLTIIDAFLLPNGNLTLVIENIGSGRFIGAIGLQVTGASGNLIGLLNTQETILLPHRTATIDTGLLFTTNGSYLIKLDRLDRIEEMDEYNNTTTVFLVASGT